MADRNPKAEGMGWVNPYLTVKSPESAMKFYEEAFGFKTNMTMPDEKGEIMHAEMKYQDAIIMLGRECEEGKSPGTLAGTPVGLYLYVDQIDSFFERVKADRAEVLQEPNTQFWGDRMFTVTCPEGHQWTFAQNVADFDPSKAPK